MRESENHWDLELDGRQDDDLLPLPQLTDESDIRDDSSYGCAQYSLTLCDVTILSIFYEKGLLSRHQYQPEVNFRSVDPLGWYHGRRDDANPNIYHPPMMTCFFDSGKDVSANLFINAPVVAVMHSMNECKTRDPPFGKTVYRSNMNFSVTSTNTCDNESDVEDSGSPDTNTMTGQTAASARLCNRYADFVTAPQFVRMLRFFGYTWTSEQGNPVEGNDEEREVRPSDMVRFWRLFRGHSWESLEGFKRFLSFFRMEKLYPYRDDASLEQQIEDLGYFFRSVCQTRLALPDGQHRIVLINAMTCGYWLPRAISPLSRASKQKFCDHWNKTIREQNTTDRPVRPTEVNINQGATMRFLFPGFASKTRNKKKDSFGFNQCCRRLVDISAKLAVSQSRAKSITAFDIIEAVIREVDRSHDNTEDQGRLAILEFDNFWKIGTDMDPVTKNFEVCCFH